MIKCAIKFMKVINKFSESGIEGALNTNEYIINTPHISRKNFNICIKSGLRFLIRHDFFHYFWYVHKEKNY